MNTEPLHILLVDDNPGDARLLRELLREVGDPFVTVHAETLADARDRLAEHRFDTVLLDLTLPDAAGLDTVLQAKEHTKDVPVIVLTGMDDQRLGLKAVQAGAQDYLVKGTVEPEGLHKTIRYAIERQRMVEELERTRKQQLEMKDQFLSHASHELRSPLTTIHQFMSILLDGLAGDLNEEQREYLEIVMRNVDQLRGMISDLLDLTRAGSGKLQMIPETVSIVEMVAGTVQSLKGRAEEKGIQLWADDIPFAPPVWADPGRLQQVLTNLVENALKFTPAGGSVTIHVQEDPEDPALVRISVADTGCGISPEGTKRIFDRLYQEANNIETSRKGLGIGLYICKELVTRHGGRLWVESELGVGSVFRFTIPSAPLAPLFGPLFHSGLPGSDWTDQADRVDVVRVELRSAGEMSPHRIAEATRRRVWSVLDQSILPGEEVLLPRVSRSATREVYLVATQPAPPGRNSAEKGLREHVARSLQLDEYGVACAVSTAPVALGAGSDEEEAGLKAALRDIVCCVEDGQSAVPAGRQEETCLLKS